MSSFGASPRKSSLVSSRRSPPCGSRCGSRCRPRRPRRRRLPTCPDMLMPLTIILKARGPTPHADDVKQERRSMNTKMRIAAGLLAGTILTVAWPAFAAQAPYAASAPDVPLSSRDRVYAAEQFSNTVSVTDPASNKLLGVIRLGDPQPGNFSPLYRGQVLVHGMGF